MQDSYFDIDELGLDREWLAQPRLYYQAATDAANARKDLDVARTQLDAIRATVAKDVRSTPESYDLDKATVDAVKETVELADEVQEAIEATHEARLRLDLCSAAVVALDHRKKALENLVYLHGQNYYSQPRAKEGTKELVQDMKSQARKERKRKKKGKQAK